MWVLDDRMKVGLRFTRSFVAWYDLAAQALAPLLVVSHACCPLDTICHHWHFHLHLLVFPNILASCGSELVGPDHRF